MSICGADETQTVCDAPDCVSMMTTREVYAWTTIDGVVARVCSEECLQALAAAESARVACTYGCGKPTTPDDRVPVVNGGVAGFAHATCQARLTNALGVQRSSMMSARGIGVLGGGRTVGLVRRTGPAFRGGRS